jgi:antitoxin MazE
VLVGGRVKPGHDVSGWSANRAIAQSWTSAPGYARNIPEENRRMPRATIGRWGKNLAIRFPAEIASAVGLTDGERVDIEASNDEVVIRKLPVEPSIDAMFAGRSPDDWRAIYRDAYDWGPDRGRELVEE